MSNSDERLEKPLHLTEEQRFYLQFILDHFHEHAQWPTHHQLDQIFLQEYPERDIEDVWKSLPPGLTSHLDINQLDQPDLLFLEYIPWTRRFPNSCFFYRLFN